MSPGVVQGHVGKDAAAGVDHVLPVLGSVLGARQQRLVEEERQTLTFGRKEDKE